MPQALCAVPNDVPSRRGKFVWELWRNGVRIEAELHDHGSWGVEVQLHRDDRFYYAQMYCSTESALHDAREWRREYCSEGWMSPDRAARRR